MASSYSPMNLAETTFKSLVWDTLLTASIADLKANVPAFNLWPLSVLTDKTAALLSNYLFDKIRLVVDVADMNMVNEAHETAYQQASIKLMIIAHDKGINSNEFIQAREDAKKALSTFVHFN